MDPNEIVGRPSEREVWLAPDWSGYKPITAPQPRGWTRVSVRDTMYADGRIVTHVLDENRSPITSQILDQQTDDKQAERFRQSQAQAQRGDQEGDVRGNEATNPNREVFHTGRGWVVEPNPLYRPPANAAGGTIRIEGTPDPSKPGGFDNERPIKVTHYPDGRPPTSEPLTPAEEKDWRENRERSRNPNGRTDAELATQKPQNQATTYETRDGRKVKVTRATVNGQVSEVVEPVTDKDRTPVGTHTTTDAAGHTVKVTTYRYPDGSTEDITDTDTEPVKPGQILPGKGPNGEDVQAMPDPANPGGVVYTVIPGSRGTRLPTDLPRFQTDISKPALGLMEFRDAVYARSDLTDDQKRQLVADAHATATAESGRLSNIISTQQAQQSNETSQRGQDMSQTSNRLSAANGVFGTALSTAAQATKYSTGPDAARVAPFLMALGMANARAFGGMENTPRVQPGPAIQQVNQMGVPSLPSVLAGPGGPYAGAPAAPAPAGPAEAEAARQQQIAANPVFRPPPPIEGQQPVPAAAPGAPDFTDPTTGQFGIPGSFSAGPYQSAAPGPALAGLFPSAPWAPAAPPVPAASPGFGPAMMARGGYDPRRLNAQLLAEGFDPEVIQQLGGVA